VLVRNISGQPLVLRLDAPFPPATPPDGVVVVPADRAAAVLCQPWYWEAADAEAWAVVGAHLDELADGELTWWDHPQADAVRAAGGPLAALLPPQGPAAAALEKVA